MRRSNFVGEVFSFFPLCMDEGSSCSMPNRECGIATMPCHAPRTAASPTMNPTKTSDEGRNYTLHLFICQHRHRSVFEVTYGKTPTAAQSAKDTVEKTLNRAGSTPLFRLSAAQVNSGGRSRPSAQWLRHVPCPRANAQKPRHNNQSERDGEQHTKETQGRGGSRSSLPRNGIPYIFGECE